MFSVRSGVNGFSGLLRTMTPADIPAGMRLTEIAGWNQTQQDWERFLAANPQGCFVAEVNGQVAGTATTIIYENRFAWIGMVLVDPTRRGKGIGTALLEQAIEHLEAKKIPCLKLDATPQGKPLYQRLGFQVEYEIERLRLSREVPRAEAGAEASGPPANHVALDAAPSTGALFQLDREVFGADRSALLRSVARAAPELVAVAPSAGAVEGFALGRKGSLADHLGPWVASNGAAARQLLEDFLVRSRRPVVFVDVVRDNPWTPALLAAKGFKFSRALTRMFRGENAHPGRPDLLRAILGPEFG